MAAGDDTMVQFCLDATDIPPLTTKDFDIDTELISWEVGQEHESRLDHITRDLRLASIYVKKTQLARQLEQAIQDESKQCMDNLPTVQANSMSSIRVFKDKWFWYAYRLQHEFESWQKQTGNDTATIAEQSQNCPNLAVHWASLYLTYCRMVIAVYNSALSVTGVQLSQALRMGRMASWDLTAPFYSSIVDQLKLLSGRGRAPFAHATDPVIWSSLYNANQVLYTSEQSFGNSVDKHPRTGSTYSLSSTQSSI